MENWHEKFIKDNGHPAGPKFQKWTPQGGSTWQAVLTSKGKDSQ